MATSTNGRRITTHEATVKTAAVEVKTLTISGKQVTLAVFRQLQNEDLIDQHSGDLLGVPWGTVNYFWGACDEGSHLHVVWQKGTELRRSCLPEAARSAFYADNIRARGSLYIHARLAEGWRPTTKEIAWERVELTVDGYHLGVTLADLATGRDRWDVLEFDEQQIRATAPDIDSEDVYAGIRDAVYQWRGFQARWKEYYRAIQMLDQLFIAV